MKTRITHFIPANSSIAIVMAFAVGQTISSLSAAPLTWDSDANSINGVTDGSGTWDTTTNGWYNGASNVAWDNSKNDTAIFGNGGTGGSGTSTVTLGTGITVGGLTFNASGTTDNYNIAGASNVLTFGGTSNTVLITANANATISAEFAAPDLVGLSDPRTLTKAGPAILELSGGGTVTFVRSGPATGSLFLTSGTYTVGGMNFYDKGIVTDDDGIVFQTGGTVNASKNWDGRFNAGPYNITGGTLNSTGTGNIRGIGKVNASGNAEVTFNAGDPRIASDNVSGTLSINDSASVSFSSTAIITLVNAGPGTTHTGTLNLSGGTLTTAGIVHGTGAPATTSSFINFNGGTLRANSSAGAGFLAANPLITASVYGGGATVDSNGKTIEIGQALLATTGNGINTAIVSAGGSGYTTAPSVTFSGGGGTGATGYALIDLSGTVTSIVITNPGRDYTSAPTIAFGSGSATATATAALANASGGFTKNGAGTLTLSGANTFTGDTAVNLGTLKIGNSLALQYSTLNYNNQGGDLDLNSKDATLGGLKGAQNLALTGKTLSIGNNNASNSYSGVLSNGSLIKIGTGTQTFSGANTYSGGTTVSGGTLLVNNTTGSGTGSGTVGVSSGTTLGGSGIISGATTSTTATVAPGSAAATVGTVTFGAGLALNTSSIFEWDMRQAATSDPGEAPAAGGTNPGSYDKVVLTGSANSLTGTDAIYKIVLGNDKSFADEFWNTDKAWNDVFTGVGMTDVNLSNIFSTFNANGTNLTAGVVAGQGTFGWSDGNTLTWTVVPEPTTSAMAGLLLGFGLLRRRRSVRGKASDHETKTSMI